jgi:hypothetical protein
MIWNLLPTLFKTGAEIYKNSQATKIAVSEAKLLHAEKNETWGNRIYRKNI